MTPRPTRLSGTLAAALIVGGIGCSPTAPSAPPPVSNDLVTQGIVPVAGKPAEHTAVQIWGTGFQSGATVTFDGSATPAIADGGWIYTMAPPHPAGPIDIAVINPDGRTSRLEKAFTYVEDLLASGDITIGPGDSVAAALGKDRTCGWDVFCRLVFIRAPVNDMVEVELVSLDRRESIGLYTSDQTPVSGLSHFPKQLTVQGGQQVWVMGEWALFSLKARLAK